MFHESEDMKSIKKVRIQANSGPHSPMEIHESSIMGVETEKNKCQTNL